MVKGLEESASQKFLGTHKNDEKQVIFPLCLPKILYQITLLTQEFPYRTKQQSHKISDQSLPFASESDNNICVTF